MIIDLHNHTQVHSRCSHLDPVDLVIRARRAGLDGLVITEHDALWPRDDVDRLAADHGLLLLRGIEVTTDIGHVLAFGFDRWHEEMKSVEQLWTYGGARGGDGVSRASDARLGRPSPARR